MRQDKFVETKDKIFVRSNAIYVGKLPLVEDESQVKNKLYGE